MSLLKFRLIPVHWTDVNALHRDYMNADAMERKRQRDWNILLKELAASPNNSFVLYNLGMIAFERQQWQEALEYFSQSFSNLPKSASLNRSAANFME